MESHRERSIVRGLYTVIASSKQLLLGLQELEKNTYAIDEIIAVKSVRYLTGHTCQFMWLFPFCLLDF